MIDHGASGSRANERVPVAGQRRRILVGGSQNSVKPVSQPPGPRGGSTPPAAGAPILAVPRVAGGRQRSAIRTCRGMEVWCVVRLAAWRMAVRTGTIATSRVCRLLPDVADASVFATIGSSPPARRPPSSTAVSSGSVRAEAAVRDHGRIAFFVCGQGKVIARVGRTRIRRYRVSSIIWGSICVNSTRTAYQGEVERR